MYFVGMNPDNNVPLANGRLLVWLSQYRGYRPADSLAQAFYPDYDLSSHVLGQDGAMLLVNDLRERIWYDAAGLVRDQSGQLGEVVSLDSTRFVDGLGAYEVCSHKGNTVVRSTTWVPPMADAFVRRFEVATVRGNASEALVYPVVHLQNVGRHQAHVFLSRLSEQCWLAVTAAGALACSTGDAARFPFKETYASGYHGSIPMHVAFRTQVSIPENGFSEPRHLIGAFGTSRSAALQELTRVRETKDCMYEETMAWWGGWHSAGATLESNDELLPYLWRTSLTLIRMCIQRDGSPVLAGFRPYQGNVWIRDGVWMAGTLALAGHIDDARLIMDRLRSLLVTRPDGGFYFSYNPTMETYTDHTYENDSMGLLLAGYWTLYEASGDTGVIRDALDLIRYCADWILENRDQTGLMKSCAGISEAFGPHLDREHEHMTWTSGISVYGLHRAADLLDAAGCDGADQYRKGAAELLDAILEHNTRDGVLRRSAESGGLDASSLLLFTQFPILPLTHPVVRATVDAIDNRLTDPFLGGVWRHDELITEEGDLKPWPFYTFALAEAHLALGRMDRAMEYLDTALGFISHCGLIPELMYTRNMARGLAMPSLATCSFIRLLLAWVDREQGRFQRDPVRAFSLRNLPYMGRRFNVEPQGR